MNIDLAREYAQLLAEKRELEEGVRGKNEELRRLEESLLTELMDNEMDSLPLNLPNGKKMTLYIHSQKWAKAKDGNRDAVVAALNAEGLTEFVSTNYNTNTLSAYVREQGKNGEEIPTGLTEVLDIATVRSLRGRSSGTTRQKD